MEFRQFNQSELLGKSNNSTYIENAHKCLQLRMAKIGKKTNSFLSLLDNIGQNLV